jgi:hypothetical protein
MSNFYCFNIGTGHNRNEKSNLLVKLFNDCPANPYLPGSEGGLDFKYINDGVGSVDPRTGQKGKNNSDKKGNYLGHGLKEKTDATVDVIRTLNDPPSTSNRTLNKPGYPIDKVFLVGHSRGAVLSLRIAAKLYDLYGDKVQVFLFLLDPVKFSNIGTDYENREIHPNVAAIQIIAMEDLHNSCLYYGGKDNQGFKLLTIMWTLDGAKKLVGTDGRKNLNDVWIRMPGSHGTGSQVDGSPIGQLTYELARRFITRCGGEVGDTPSTDDQLCELYFQIIEQNPVQHVPVSKRQKLFGKTSLARTINDNPDGQKDHTKVIATDSRAKWLDKKGIENPYRGHDFFVNNHHADLAQGLYPAVYRHVKNSGTGFRPIVMSTLDYINKMNLRRELQLMRTACPTGYDLFDGLYLRSVAS